VGGQRKEDGNREVRVRWGQGEVGGYVERSGRIQGDERRTMKGDRVMVEGKK